jgi:hypothetical protein
MPLKDPIARAAYNKQWRLDNLAHSRAYHRAYYRVWRDTDARRKYDREWKAARPEEGVKSRKRMQAQRSTETGKERQRAANWRSAGLPMPTRPRPKTCECCGQPALRTLCNDHDYATGAFRGWLCGNCNRGLGLLGDNVTGLMKAMSYLTRLYDPYTGKDVNNG